MYLGLMRFPCSVNELLRMRSCTDIPIHKETRIRILRHDRFCMLTAMPLCFISVITFKLPTKS